ncbi:uncharacterized protein [Apostichopus japonicus]|uniref:uncharacterized protein isoform X2 n=1 Tax=Stichopus japonicus TaxID=307972 RepID=UPI003AB891A7
MDVRISTFNVIAMFNAFFFFSCLHLVYTTELNQTVLVNSSVLLNCDGLLSESRKWKFNMSYVLFYNNAPMSTRFKDTATLTKNYSLSIKPVEISHEGFYECIYGTHVTKHYLRVEVPPNVNVTTDIEQSNANMGTVVAADLIVAQSENVTATCFAIGARPFTVLRWLINGEFVEDTDVSFEITTNHLNKATFDSIAHLSIRPTTFAGNITCAVHGGTIWLINNITLSYYVYAPPIYSLLVNGNVVYINSTEALIISSGSTVTATCLAQDSRPSSNISLLVDEDVVHSNSDLWERYSNTSWNTSTEFYYTIKTVRYFARPPGGSISCIGSWPLSANDTELRKLYTVFHAYETERSSDEHTNRQTSQAKLVTIILPVAIIGAVFVSVFIILMVKHRGIGLLVVDNSSSQRQSEGCYSAPGGNRDSSQKMELLQHDIEKTQQGSSCITEISDEHPKEFSQRGSQTRMSKRNVELPEIPVEKRDPQHLKYTAETNEPVYYSSIREGVPETKIYLEEDMCKIVTLKSGLLYNRWMGTIPSSMKAKCVIITTASDAALFAKQIRWESYIKRVLELPVSDSIPNVEGICIASEQLYLLHEHYICGTLEATVKRQVDDRTSTYEGRIPLLEVKGYISNILSGIQLIHSYGFLHPGLSTKKILLTKTGVCKLYDFCLAEDATGIILSKKSKKTYLADHFPPETTLRNEYTPESDVWALAVVILEIVTGETELDCNIMEDDHDDAVLQSFLQKVWPAEYDSLRADVICDCWRQKPSMRPTVCDLRSSLTEIWKETLSSESPGSEISFADIYVPMGGNVQKVAECSLHENY